MKKYKIIYLITFILIACLQVEIFAPGCLSPDSIEQLQQAVDGIFSDWHPPLMSVVWKILNIFIFGGYGMFLFNLFLYWLGFYLIIEKIVVNDKLKIIYFAALNLFPSILCQHSAIWKDTHFTGIMIILLAILISDKFRFRNILFFIIAFYAMSIRYNSIFAVFPLIVFFFATENNFLKSVLKGTISSILILLTSLVISSLITTTKKFPAQMVQSYDLAGISVKTNTVKFPAFLEKQISLPKLNLLYTPTTVWPIFSEWEGIVPFVKNKEDAKTLTDFWLKTIIENPFSYLQHRKDIFFELITPKTAIIAWYEFTNINPYGLTFRERNSHLMAIQFFKNLSESFIFKPITYILINIILLILSLFKRNKLLLYLNLSPLLYLASGFFLVPGADFRYLYWVVISALISVIITLQKEKDLTKIL